MKLSVVILNYNVKYFIDICLQSVCAATEELDAEVIVVDNASIDGSVTWIKQQFPKVVVVENKKNTGFPKGNNIGVAKAKGDYICILNPDTIVAENTFKEALLFMQLHPNVGIMGPKLLDGSGVFLKESKRSVPTPWVAFTKVAGLYKISPQLFGRYYNQRLHKNKPGPTDILVGAFMFMSAADYRALEGFDEDCFMYSDDIDLSYRLLQSGKQNFYNPSIKVVHFKGESTPKDFAFQMMFREAMNYFYTKHFHVSNFVKMWIKFATYVFSFLKRMRGSEKLVKRFVPKRYWLISKELNLEIGVDKNIPFTHTRSLHGVFKHRSSRTELIFDSDTISFAEMIDFMDTNGNSFSYKFLSSDKKHAVGSNSSIAKGEVLVMY